MIYRATILLVVAIIAINALIIGHKSDLFVFPFDVRVWGGVSDWVMICVTGLTAFLLYRTLKSQTAIQKMQQRITNIEDFKFRRELMPVFDIKGVPPIYFGDRISTKYHILARNNVAKNIIIRCESKYSKLVVTNSWNQKDVKPDNVINFHHDIPKENDKQQSFEIRIYITFEDIAQNRYFQYAEIIKPDRPTQSYGERTEPTLITEGLDISQ